LIQNDWITGVGYLCDLGKNNNVNNTKYYYICADRFPLIT